jgi:hypothetical protein
MNHLKIIRLGVLLVWVCLVLKLPLFSQAQVTVTPTVYPPYSPYFNDYLQLTNAVVIIQNNTAGKVNLKLSGRIEGDNGLYLGTKPGYQPRTPIVLDPFETKYLYANSSSLEFIDRRNLETNASELTQNDVLRTGILPEGNYFFCIQAFDYNTGVELSFPSPAGCTMIPISYPQPPVITSPLCESTVFNNLPTFSWTPPVGNVGGANLRYDLYILKLLPGAEPNYAMQLAVDYRAGNPLVISNLTYNTYAYAPYDPPLQDGATYAMQVVVRDLNNHTVFENGGRSEVCTFTYDGSKLGPGGNEQNAVVGEANVNGGICSCETQLTDLNIVAGPQVSPGTMIQVGDFMMTVVQVTAPPDAQGKFSGIGTIPVPFMNVQQVKIRVNFTDIQVNGDMAVVAGEVRARIKDNTSFMPSMNPPNWDGITLSPEAVQDLSTYFSNQVDQVVSSTQNAFASIGFEMPMGVDAGGQTIAITDVNFYPTYATFNALIAFDLFDGNPSVIALGGKDICLTSSQICGEATLFLAEDFNFSFLSGGGGIKFLGMKNVINSPQDSGTYVRFGVNGFERFRLHGEFQFPQSTLVAANGGGPVKATLTASMASWDDWVASIAMDDFNINGMPDITFIPGGGFYDHSMLYNPAGLPANLYPETGAPTWQGFYYSIIGVKLPPFLESNGNPVTINAQHLLIDNQGVSVQVAANNVIALGNAGVNDWRFSVDQIGFQIRHNAFTQGGFNGKLLLPITSNNAQSRLNYNCLLSMGNSGFNYQFTVQPKDNIEIPLWVATMDLFNTSNISINNNNGSFVASAVLNGKMSIVADVGFIPAVQLAHMEFSGLTLSTQSPYFSPGQINMALGSPDHSFAGFPIGITKVDIVADQPSLVGVQFTVNVNLTDSPGLLPSGSTTLAVYGGFNGGPHFDHAEVRDITIDADLSILHVAGTIKFYHSDPVYGRGFRGQIMAEMPPAFGFQSTLQFGKVNGYNYWYVDGLVKFEPGVPLFPGTQAFGFGGGAYYHMTQNYSAITSINSNGNSANPQPGASASGITYVPNQNVALGLKATIYLGLQAKELFNADVTLDISFTNGGGLNIFSIYGNARMISDPDMQNGLLEGSLSCIYDHPNKIFASSVSVHLDLALVEAHGAFSFYFQGMPEGQADRWHLRFGRPENVGQPISLEILGFLGVKSYFQAGNFEVDDMPPPPAWIVNILNNSGYSFSSVSKRGQYNPDNQYNLRFIHGASAGFHFKGNFLCFYASLDAGFGYDLLVEKVVKNCDGTGDGSDVGMNGWYAIGQAYAGVNAEIGIEVDLGFVSGSFSIIKAGLAAYLKIGAVNPTWAEGAVGGYYSILDGLIEGYCHFKFQVGNKCLPPTGDPLENIKIIADMNPQADANGNATDVQDLRVIPAVAVNIKMNINKNIFIEERLQGSEESITRQFRFHKDLVKLELHKKTNNAYNIYTKIADSNFELQYSDDGYGIILFPKMMLDKNSDYKFIVRAKIEERKNGVWQVAKRKNGQVFEEVREVRFKTSPMLNNLIEGDIAYTFPYQLERYFMYQDRGPAKVKTIQGINPLNFVPEGYNQNDVRLAARFIPLSPGQTPSDDLIIEIKDANKLMEFDYPGQLLPNTRYVIQILAQWKKGLNDVPAAPNSSIGNAFTMSVQQNLLTYQIQNPNTTVAIAQINARHLIESTFLARPNEKLIYRIEFSTSKHPNLASKVTPMTPVEVRYNIKHNGQYKFFTLKGNELASAQTIAATLRQKAGIGPNGPLCLKYIPSIWLTGNEFYDVFDIVGYSKWVQIGYNMTSIKHDPLVKFENPAVTQKYSDMFDQFWNTLISGGYAQSHVDKDRVGGKMIKDFFSFGVWGNYHQRITSLGNLEWYANPLNTQNYIEQMIPYMPYYNMPVGTIGSGSGPGGFQWSPSAPKILELYTLLAQNVIDIGFGVNNMISSFTQNMSWNGSPTVSNQLGFYSNVGVAYDLAYSWIEEGCYELGTIYGNVGGVSQGGLLGGNATSSGTYYPNFNLSGGN